MKKCHVSLKRFFSVSKTHLLLLSLAVLLISVACSKEDKSASGARGTTPAATASEFAKTLVAKIPSDAFAFFLWQGDHPAYAKLGQSQWGAGKGQLSKLLEGSASGSGFEEIKGTLKNIGLDPENADTWKNSFSEGVFFAVPGAAGAEPAVGLLYRGAGAANPAAVLPKLKAELGGKGAKIQDAKTSKGTAFAIESMSQQDGGQMKKVFVGWDSDIGAVSSNEVLIERMLASTGTAVPAIVDTENFRRAFTGLPATSVRFGTGYVDIEKALAEAKKSGNAQAVSQLEMANVPLKAISFGIGMEETPVTSVRVIYDKAAASQNAWMKSLSNSQSAAMLGALPSKPLLFLSIDGPTLQRVKDAAMAGMGPQGAMLGQQLAFLDQTKRLGLVVRSAPLGQSMLPIPDMLAVFETGDTAKTSTQLQSIVGMAIQSSGMPGMPWTDKKIQNTPVKSMVSPFGVGVHVASTKNLVLLSSSEPQLTQALSSSSGEGKGFAKEIPARVEQVFAKEQTLGTLYLNFEELATMMESMGGMMAMYAPQGQGDTQKLLQAENIEAMKKMGTIVGAVRVEPDSIGIDSFYQKPAA